MKEIALKLLLVFGLTALVLICFDFAYRQTYNLDFKIPRNVVKNPPIDEKYRIVKLGNSHTQDGITFEKYKTKSLDLSGVAQRFETDLAVLRQHQNQIDEGAVVLINVSPISFSHTNANTKKGFQAGYYGRVSPLYIPNLNWSDYIESEFLSFARSGHYWRQKYAKKVLDEKSAGDKSAFERNAVKTEPTPAPELPPVPLPAASANNTPPRDTTFDIDFILANLEKPTKIPGKFENSVNFMYTKWYQTDEFNPDYFAVNKKDLERLIAFCLKQNWKPVLITIPISQELEDGLLDDYKQVYLYDVLSQTDTQGVEYLDFSSDPQIKQNNLWFGNSDHLSKQGAAAFSYFLLQDLIEKGYLPAEVNGYEYGAVDSGVK